ncbi:hypothetical protein TRIUR3_29029 [Triticum urartu]|uniref:Wall-associated receptor kinase C-terminal domain-containing protein n=1 Tax=Triticum urartu TaxID=4572 RepID=M7ZEN4_TRIUA|nr:hypothetical protein TRIUR3_29029 [Triticum urartu]
MSCCAYRPRAAESLRAMLRHCEAYTTVYWRAVGDKFPPYDQVPDYGVRVDFEIPVTTRCLQCQDRRRGANGTCGFDPATRDFVCICDGGRNSTTDCAGLSEDEVKKKGRDQAGGHVFQVGSKGGAKVNEEEEDGGLFPPLSQWRRNAAGAIIATPIYTNNFTAVITNSSPLYAAV